MPPSRSARAQRQAARRVSFESHEVFYLAAEVTADIQSAHQDELIRERNPMEAACFPVLGSIVPNPAEHG